VRKADNLSSSCSVVMKSGNLNFLEPCGPLQACNGTAKSKINIKITPTRFGVLTPSSGSLQVVPAKVKSY